MNKTYNAYMCRQSLDDKLNKFIGRSVDDCFSDKEFLNIVNDSAFSGISIVAMRNSLGFITSFIKQKAP